MELHKPFHNYYKTISYIEIASWKIYLKFITYLRSRLQIGTLDIFHQLWKIVHKNCFAVILFNTYKRKTYLPLLKDLYGIQLQSQTYMVNFQTESKGFPSTPKSSYFAKQAGRQSFLRNFQIRIYNNQFANFLIWNTPPFFIFLGFMFQTSHYFWWNHYIFSILPLGLYNILGFFIRMRWIFRCYLLFLFFFFGAWQFPLPLFLFWRNMHILMGWMNISNLKIIPFLIQI